MNLRPALALAIGLLVHGNARGTQYFVGDRPEPLVRPPFPCPPGVLHDDELSVRVHVGADGFVDSSFFVGVPPPDSAAIVETARRWLFRPVTFQDSPIDDPQRRGDLTPGQRDLLHGK